MNRWRRSRTFGARALLLLVTSSLAGLALCEMLVRLLIPEPILPRFVLDTGYGIRDNMPGIRTRHTSPGDFAVEVTTNRHGMRDARREYAPGRQPGVRRVALLGDSFVFGYGVEEDEVISAALERLLNESGSGKHEVLNFGVPGFGQAEELLLYRHKVRRFSPDVVVLFYFENDLGNNVVSGLFAVDSTGAVVRTGQAYLPGVAIRQRLYAFPPTRWAFEHSHLWNLLRNRLSLLVQQKSAGSHGMRSFGTQTEQSVRLTRALLRELVVEIERDGALPIVCTIPTRERHSNFPLEAGELEACGTRWVDARDWVTPDDYYRRDTHWRASGHARVARVLADVLRSPGAGAPAAAAGASP